jgi:hypothetical protein
MSKIDNMLRRVNSVGDMDHKMLGMGSFGELYRN